MLLAFMLLVPAARAQDGAGFRFGQPYYSHLFIDTVYKNSDPYIPCQSVYDVRLAARLGFRYVEANLHATATPGKYLVIHGYRGALGYQVEDLDGNFAPLSTPSGPSTATVHPIPATAPR